MGVPVTMTSGLIPWSRSHPATVFCKPAGSIATSHFSVSSTGVQFTKGFTSALRQRGEGAVWLEQETLNHLPVGMITVSQIDVSLAKEFLGRH